MTDTDPPTGNIVGTAIGGVGGAGIAALFGASKPTIAVAGIAGAGLGYYMTTLRFSAAGILEAGGKVYALGDYVIIDIPTDSLFDANTDDFLPSAEPILNSLVSVLNRYNGHNLFISGNTSGSWTERFERRMSECRAAQIASYLWAHGITNAGSFRNNPLTPKGIRRLIYIGYGDNFPIANIIHIKGIRTNSRIQIVASPSNAVLHWDQQNKKHFKEFTNIGDSSPENPATMNPDLYAKYAYAFSDDHMTESTTLRPTGQITGDSTTIQGNVPPPVKDQYAENGASYNNVVSEPQTLAGVSVTRQAGYKGEDFKSEGRLPS
ncbi:MAG: OmpA family protein [Pseudomonadota bacterium]